MKSPTKSQNLLTDAERERLTMLIEEAAKIIHVSTKIMRHEYLSYDQLEKELMDFWAIYEFMALNKDLTRLDFLHSKEIWKKKLEFAHFQDKDHFT